MDQGRYRSLVKISTHDMIEVAACVVSSVRAGQEVTTKLWWQIVQLLFGQVHARVHARVMCV